MAIKILIYLSIKTFFQPGASQNVAIISFLLAFDLTPNPQGCCILNDHLFHACYVVGSEPDSLCHTGALVSS